jgi:hypothetical protein
VKLDRTARTAPAPPPVVEAGDEEGETVGVGYDSQQG